MNNALKISLLAGSLIAPSAQAVDLGYGFFEFDLQASSGTTFTITDHQVHAVAVAVFDCLTPGSTSFCPPDVDLDPCIDSTSCFVEATAGAVSCTGSGTYVQVSSEFTALSSTHIAWEGYYYAELTGSQDGCPDPLGGFSASPGFEIEFSVDGDFTLTPPDCPDPADYPDSIGRQVIANIICLPSGPIASSLVLNGSDYVDICSTSTMLGSGSYSIISQSVIINDSTDDVTADGRFNQDDVDYLTSISPTTSSTYTARFDYDGDGDVDGADIAFLQCFVDACLDARRLGDADCDNDVDCDDLTAVLAQAFAGEAFDDTSTTYKVGFDADLDGDNDATDKAIMRDVFLAVEPSNFILDGALNFFDYSEWQGLYNAQDPRADLNNDGIFNFYDTSIFTQYYNTPNCLPDPNP